MTVSCQCAPPWRAHDFAALAVPSRAASVATVWRAFADSHWGAAGEVAGDGRAWRACESGVRRERAKSSWGAILKVTGLLIRLAFYGLLAFSAAGMGLAIPLVCSGVLVF